MSSIKFVDLETTMEQGDHLNKSHLDLMQNGGAIAIDFYWELKKVRSLSI